MPHGTLDGPKAREKAAEYKAEIAAIDAELAAAARTSPTAALLATGKELRKRWAALTPSVRSQIIDEIAVVTIQPTRRGVRTFDPTAIDVVFRDRAAVPLARAPGASTLPGSAPPRRVPRHRSGIIATGDAAGLRLLSLTSVAFKFILVLVIISRSTCLQAVLRPVEPGLLIECAKRQFGGAIITGERALPHRTQQHFQPLGVDSRCVLAQQTGAISTRRERRVHHIRDTLGGQVHSRITTNFPIRRARQKLLEDHRLTRTPPCRTRLRHATYSSSA